jgi:hypothetical protein
MDLPKAECGAGYFPVPDPTEGTDIDNTLAVQLVTLSGWLHGNAHPDSNVEELTKVHCSVTLAHDVYDITNHSVDLTDFAIRYDIKHREDNIAYPIVIREQEDGVEFVPQTPVMILERIRTLMAEGTWEITNG